MNDATAKRRHRRLRRLGGCALLTGSAALAANCGGSSPATGTAGSGSTGSTGSTAATGSGGASSTSSTVGSTTGSATGGSPATSSATTGTGAGTTTGSGGSMSAHPAGWLYTSGSKILVSDGTTGKPWMGRGVNVDDIYLCGYNNSLWLATSDQALSTMLSGLVTEWKPNFIRISLGMDSNVKVSSWLGNDAQYKTPMTGVINALGANPGVYVLITLRSDTSMIGQDTADGDPEATGLPSDSTTTPNAATFPTGTDATYVALVDTFAHASFAMFGITNEPGGNKLSSAKIAAAMSHAVKTIRAEEDKLGVPHHLVSVQGNGWTSDISTYATTPLLYDNVVYEVHGYPPAASSYTYANLPVILGEYGSLSDSAAFYADVEAKQIPNLAWDFEAYSNCGPDLLTVTHSSSPLAPTAWGSVVKAYLLAHAQ